MVPLTAGHVCRVLVNLLAHPNTDAPINASATKLLVEDPAAFRGAVMSHAAGGGMPREGKAMAACGVVE